MFVLRWFTILFVALASASFATAPNAVAAGGAKSPKPNAGNGAGNKKKPQYPWREVWAGGEILGSSWSVFSGSTIAWSDIRRPGWRIRTGGGYSTYRYDGELRFGNHRFPQRFRGRKAFSELMVGYQFQAGTTTLKLFAGGASESHSVSPFDPDNEVYGAVYGGKAALETWTWLSERRWLKADAAVATLP